MSEVDTTAAQPTENVNTNTEATAGSTAAQTAEAAAQPNLDLTAGQVAEFLGTTPANLEKFQRFVEANGFDAAFSKLKKDVSTPAEPKESQTDAAQPAQLTQPAQSVQQPQSAEPTEAPQVAKGYLSPQDFALRQYFNSVASEEKYAAIKSDITSGKVLKEMDALGIKATDAQGNYNDEQIHAFLDLKAATIPAKTVTVEPTSTPTVTFTDVEGEITSIEQAQKIYLESANGRARGAGDHPKLEEAKKFMAAQLGFSQKK